jgi:mannosyl-3-phosphoglycerate phosphatase
MNRRIVVFSDLDGTLLDHHTYSFAAAEPALRLLRRTGIPLVICSSKTRSEIEVVREALGNADPFIAENGGAVFIPAGYFRRRPPSARTISGYDVVEFGEPYARVLRVFRRIKKRFPGKLRGFSELSVEAVAGLAGLSARESALAKKREYDEPFILADPAALEGVQEIARQSGLNVVRGGRFFHLMGDNDKGKAARFLQSAYAEFFDRPIYSLGLGDSANDLTLLASVDCPVLVQKPGGGYDPSISLGNLHFARGEGPEGWRAALLDLVPRLAG